MVCALTGGAFLLFGSDVINPPAFAQVEGATRNILNAQWKTTYSRLDIPTNKAFRFTARQFARIGSPARRMEYLFDGYTVTTPETGAVRWRIGERPAEDDSNGRHQ